MNKATLALKISEKLNVPKKVAEDFIALFQDLVTESLKNDDEVTIAGFGTFSSRVRAARKGVNPRKPTEIINVPAVKVPKFKAGKTLKDALKASTSSAPAAAPAKATEAIDAPIQNSNTVTETSAE
ncbi:HU family DNA-binding protein [Patescibacteria group bacterium]|nr:HU family DNA-binding protein [Patescibacteria group bacterium]